MKLRRNLLAGVASSIWLALVGFAVVPLYLKYLGMEAYGLIGFFATTQALTQLLDFGLAPTMNREVARGTAAGDLRSVANLLHTLSLVYWVVAILIALVVIALAPLIAGHWIQARQIPVSTVQQAIMLMGVSLACRWPVSLYQGALMGAQRMVLSSGITVAMATLGNVGAILVLAWVSPTIQAFFIWQACVGFACAAVMRLAAWRVLAPPGQPYFDAGELKRIWRFSAGMSGVALLGIIFTQMDKVLLSRILGLEEFGRYMLATLVTGGLYIAISPVYNAVFPRFSSLAASGADDQLWHLYRLATRLMGCFLFPMAMVLAVDARDVLFVWTGNAEVASLVAPMVSFLALGSALHGVMYIPHALQLAHGLVRLPLTINLSLLVVFSPLLLFMAIRHGGEGAAVTWLILHVMYAVLSTWLTHRQLFVGQGRTWLLRDVAMPLAISVVTGLVAWGLLREPGLSLLGRLAVVGLAALVSLGVSVLVFPDLREIARELLAGKTGFPGTAPMPDKQDA